MGKSRYVFKLTFNPVKIEAIIHKWLEINNFKYISKGKKTCFRAGNSKKNYTFFEYYITNNELVIFAYVSSEKRPFPLENGMIYSTITVPYRMLLDDLFFCINNPDDKNNFLNRIKKVKSVSKKVDVKNEIDEEKIIKVDQLEDSDSDIEKDISDDVKVESKEKCKRKKKSKEISKSSQKRRSVFAIISFVMSFINFVMSVFGMIMGYLFLVLIYVFAIYGLKSKKSKFSIIGLIFLAISLLIMIIRYRIL